MGWLQDFDDLLRGRKTEPRRLAEEDIDLPLRVFVPLAIAFGAVYGFFMGWFALANHESAGGWQLLASMLKVPALFLLTLIVTFPSLYVFNALVGCRLSMTATLRLLVGIIVINLTVAASLGPILGFFTLSTTSYPFMIVLNVALLSFSGLVALGFLLRTLRRVAARQSRDDQADTDVAADPASAAPGRSPPADALGPANTIFRIWVIIYALVGAQMGWLLRPFIGSPELPFQWLRPRQGNFVLGLMNHVRELLGGS